VAPVTTTPQPSGRVVHRMCPSCDVEPPAGLVDPSCPSCGARLVEVRAPADDIIGKVIDGRFEIRDQIGEGGMGTVYRAWQRSIGREVAIKLIDQRHVRDSMSVRRFLREARLASQLSQPNTISVFDFGQAEDGRLFIAMELVRGKTLRDVVVADGPFSVARAMRIGVQLCDALDAAHGLQIVHRDLKPANVLILDDPPGRDLVKVLDFGLAKSLAEDESESTKTGFVVGTPRYMAPEVALGGPPSVRSDLYAVGVLLAEITTGQRLWDQANFSQLVIVKNRGLPETPQVPPALRPLLVRLVSPEPNHRPASAAALRTALQALAEGADAGSPVIRSALDGPARPRLSAASTTVGFETAGRPDITADTSVIGGDPEELRATAPEPSHVRSAIEDLRATIPDPGSMTTSAAAPRGRPVLVIGAVASVVLAAALTIWVTRGGDARAPAQARAPAIDAGVRIVQPIDASPATTVVDPAPPDAAVEARPAASTRKKPPPKKVDPRVDVGPAKGSADDLPF